MSKASHETVYQEFEHAYSLIRKMTGIDFIKPTLCIGDEHRPRFFEFNSMRDLGRYGQIQMIYDEVTNSILVPEHLLSSPFIHLPNYARDNRCFGFRHECVHALSSQINPEKDVIVKSKRKKDEETKYVFVAFDEGLANHLAIDSASLSDDEDIKEKAKQVKNEMIDGYKEWTGNKGNMEIMAKVYGQKPDDIAGILHAYFSATPYILEPYKYLIGYRFIQLLRPRISRRNLRALIQNPPTTIRQLIYPETCKRAN